MSWLSEFLGGGSRSTTTTNTTNNVTNTAPPEEVMAAYRDVMARSQAAAAIPYQAYQGPVYQDIWAGFLPEAIARAHQGATAITPQLAATANANMNPFAAAAAAYGQNPNIGNYATTGGQGLATIGSLLGGNLADYGTGAADSIMGYGTGAAGNLAGYGTNAAGNLAGTGLNYADAIGRYGETAGRNVSDFANTAGQNVASTGLGFASDIAGYGRGAGDEIANYATGMGSRAPQFQAFSPQAIAQYMAPYTQNVVDATSRQFAHDNNVQSQGVIGNAIRSNNAFGGDRMGIALAELGGAQRRAQDPIIAGLYNQGYSQALGQFNTGNQQAQQSYGTTLGGLSNARQLGLGALTSGAGIGTNAAATGANIGTQGALSGANLGLGALTSGAGVGTSALTNAGQLGTSALSTAATTGLGALTSGAGIGTNALGTGANLTTSTHRGGLDAALQGQIANANLGMQGLNLGAQGYGQAQQLGLSSLSSDAARAMAAGQTIAGLGQITQANNQAGNDAAYQQWQIEQAYPFAVNSYLAANVLGTGAQMGGTATTTGTTSGTRTDPRPAFGGLKHGGRVPHRALGGGVPWIKYQPLPRGGGLPQPLPGPQLPGMGGGEGSGGGQKSQQMDLGKGLKAAGDLYKNTNFSDMFSGVPSPKGPGFSPVQDIGNLSYAMGPELPAFYTAAGEGLAGAAAGIGEAASLGGLGAEAALGAAGVGAEVGLGALGAGFGAEMALAGAGIMEGLGALAALFMNRGGAVNPPVRRFADGGLALPPLAAPPMQAPPAFADPEMANLMSQVGAATEAFKAMRGKSQGGLVMPSPVPRSFAGGGFADVEILSPDEYNRFDAMADRPRFDVSDANSPNWAVARGFQDMQAGDGPTFDPPPTSMPQTMAMPMPQARPAGLGGPPEMPPLFARLGTPPAPLPANAMQYDGAAPSGGGLSLPPNAQPTSGTAPSGLMPRREQNALDEFMQSPWFALATGVLGAMASRSPYPGVALAEGALTGLSTYAAARKMSDDAEKIRAQLQRQDLQQQETVRHNRSTESHRDRALTETTAQRRDAARERTEDRRDNLASKGFAGKGPDPETGQTVDGFYQYNPDTRNHDFKAGKVVTGKGGAQRDPAAVASAKWLVEQKIAPDLATGYDMARAGVNEGATWQRLVQAEHKLLSSDPDYLSASPQDKEKMARERVIGRRPMGKTGPAAASPAPAADGAPVPGAKKAPDGNWYTPDPARPGKYLLVKP